MIPGPAYKSARNEGIGGGGDLEFQTLDVEIKDTSGLSFNTKLGL